jgi:Fic family protein
VAIFVVVFLEIHPFDDGNGRLSRILTTLLMLQFGYTHVPYSSLESIVEQNKSGYYIALRQTQASIRGEQPNWQPWLVFFLSSLASQVKRLAEKVAEVAQAIAGYSGLGQGAWPNHYSASRTTHRSQPRHHQTALGQAR